MNNCAGNQTFTDQDRMGDLLAQEKYLIDAYSTFIPEATCPKLRGVLEVNFNECAQNAYVVFDKMSQLGWYPTKAAPQQEIDAARQKFQQMQSQMG